MPTLVTIAEAASYLGVSKATLRNWDREGKLRAKRHPLNAYRCYRLEDLRRLKEQVSLLEDEPAPDAPALASHVGDAKSARRLVSRLHNILRDRDGDSSLLLRFDEVTKLLFLKLAGGRLPDSRPELDTQTEHQPVAQSWRRAYSELATTYQQLIPPAFSRLQCSDAALTQCAEVLEQVTLANDRLDVKGLAYEEVIRGTFDKSDNQQFFTPPQVVSFICDLLKAEISGTVMDPACGTAGFLVDLVKNGSDASHLVGVEIDARLAWVSGINLLVHGATDFEIRCIGGAGSLGSELDDLTGQVDAIITNPPFGSDLSDGSVLGRYSLGAGRSSRRRGILFLEKCASLLREGGVVGIVLDEGVLNLPSATDVRQFILDTFDVLAIVSLPETAFLPYASVAASILFLRKSSQPIRNSDVFFARAERIGRRPNGDDDIVYEEHGISRIQSDLPMILEQWRRHSAGESIAAAELWYTANVTTRLKDDTSLRLDFRFHHPSREECKQLLSVSTQPLKSLSSLCKEISDTVIPSTELADQTILYTGLANIEANTGLAVQTPTAAASLKSAVKAYEPGDILFAKMRPNLRKVAFAAFAEGGYCSPECVVLRVRRDAHGIPVFDPELLSVVLRSDLVFGQILHLVAGIGRPRLNATDLRRVVIPVPPLNVQSTMLQRYRASLLSVRELRAQAALLQERASGLGTSAVNQLARDLVGVVNG